MITPIYVLEATNINLNSFILTSLKCFVVRDQFLEQYTALLNASVELVLKYCTKPETKP